jgi:hypothetical protein
VAAGTIVTDGLGKVGIGTSSPANPLEVTQGASSSVAGIKVSGPTWTMLDLVTTNAYSEARNWRLAGVFNSFGLFEIISGSTSGGAPNTTVLGLKKASSVALEGATPQTGAGITFPATQSASTDANTLDDYEEGTWTPSAFNGSGTGITYVASYVKIGRQVSCFFAINGTGLTTTAASTTLSGLPFPPSNVPTGSSATYMGISMNGQTNNSGAIQAFSDSKIYFTVTFSSTTQISGTVTYLTST